MGKRFAIVIGVAAAGVMALGAQTATAAPPVDTGKANVCVNVNGANRVVKGSAICFIQATVQGTNSRAIAVGENAIAAVQGADSRAMAVGEGTEARVLGGTGNTARAIGAGSDATVGSPGAENNTATAIGGGFADAGDFGTDNNTATAIGEGSVARAQALTGCTARAIHGVVNCP